MNAYYEESHYLTNSTTMIEDGTMREILNWTGYGHFKKNVGQYFQFAITLVK